MPDWSYELKEWNRNNTVIGVDEAGRGPLAGPVVAAAVQFREPVEIPYLRDSKKMTARQREMCYDIIRSHAVAVGVAAVGPTAIDAIGILKATYLAMKRAIEELPHKPDAILVDGRPVQIGLTHQALVKGDDRSFSIAAASVIAKVLRDRMMNSYHLWYPEFEFNLHKGYPTPRHKQLLKEFTPTPIHRFSFSDLKWDLFHD